MKKFSKILCAVLMVALLCATVAVFVGAESPTPTMKVTAASTSDSSKKAMFNHSSSSAEGNSLDTVNWVASSGTSNPLDMFNSYVVEEDGDESFVALYAPKTMTGMHTQYVVVDSKRTVQITNQHYYVVSFDLASQTSFPEKLAVSLLHRNSGGGGTDLASVQIVLKNYVGDLSDGKWVNITLVGQIDVALNDDGSVNKDNTVNKMHIYVNGKYAASVDGALHHNNLLSGKIPDTYDSGKGLFAEGFRIELPSSSTVNAGESVFIDNLYRHDMTKADAETNGLASVVAEHSALSEWEANTLVSRAGTEIPAFIKIGDKEYNNTNKVNEALASTENAEVEVIGENIAPITFTCDATVTTNGFNLLYTGVTGTKFDTTQDGIIKVDAPYKSDLTKVPTSGAAQIMEAVKYDAPDNLLVNIAQQQLSADSNAKDFVQQYIESINGDDNAYISHYVTKDTTVTSQNIANYNYTLHGSNKQIHMHTNLQIGSDGKTTGYIIPAAADRTEDMYAIFEWDMYTADGMPYGMYAGITFRNMSGGNVSGTSFYFDGQEANDTRKIESSLPIGEWYHFAMIADLQTNTTYVYINNVYVTSYANTIANALSTLQAGGKLEGPRINIYYRDDYAHGGKYTKGEMFAIDNYYARVFTGNEAENLASVLGTGNIDSWTKNVYDENYAEENFPKVFTYATLDGEDYTQLGKVDSILNGNTSHEMTLYATPYKTLQIKANVVIDTNGIILNQGEHFAVPEGSTVTANGNILTITVPYQPNVTYELLSGGGGGSSGNGSLGMSIATGVEGNMLTPTIPGIPNNGAGGKGWGNQYLAPYLATDMSGDSYLTLFPTDNIIGGNFSNNPYIFYENYAKPVPMNDDCYYVIDLDVYSEDHALEGMSITPSLRSSVARMGAALNVNDVVKGKDGWIHVTYVGVIGTNTSYVFFNGEYAGMLSYAYDKRAGENVSFYGFRFNLTASSNVSADSMVGIRNVSARAFTSNEAADNIQAALDARDITLWSKNVEGYKGAATAIALIDGVEYSTTSAASKALATGGSHEVEFLHDFNGVITTSDSATLTSHGYGELAINAVSAKLDLDASELGCTGNAYVGYNMIVDGNNYIRIDETNFADYCIASYWFASIDDAEPTDVIFFPAGSEVKYAGELQFKNNYIENGKLYSTIWYDGEMNPFTGYTVTASDVAQGLELYYALYGEAVETDITVTEGMKYNLSLYANFDVNLYIKDANGAYEIDGVKYAKYTQQIAVNNLASDLVYEIKFTVDGVEYTEKIVINVLDYAKTVLGMDTVSDQMKRVMMSALNYANEAYALLNGGANANIAAILANPANAAYIVEDYTNYGDANTNDINSVISGAQLYLTSDVAVMFKVANGYTGKVTVSYNDYKGQACSHEFNVAEGQEYIVVDALKVYNLGSVFTITAGEVSGSYNLGAYIQGLVEGGQDAGFAQALYTYAKVAKDYKTALNNAQ